MPSPVTSLESLFQTVRSWLPAIRAGGVLAATKLVNATMTPLNALPREADYLSGRRRLLRIALKPAFYALVDDVQIDPATRSMRPTTKDGHLASSPGPCFRLTFQTRTFIHQPLGITKIWVSPPGSRLGAAPRAPVCFGDRMPKMSCASAGFESYWRAAWRLLPSSSLNCLFVGAPPSVVIFPLHSL